MKKKKEIKIEPFTLLEWTTINKITTEMGILKKAHSNGNGGFTHISLKSDKPFDMSDIKTIISYFSKRYNKDLTFEQCAKNGEFYVGNLTKVIGYV